MLTPRSSDCGRERGQTILIVAISFISLLAMAALAIDVVTLYVARSEIQRAADAAALAAAKAIADSGVTSVPTADAAAAQTLAVNMATAAINAVLQNSINLVAGAAPVCSNCPVAPDWTRQGNPLVTVTLQRTNLPTFFARIWGTRSAAVVASATAEAYNAANNTSITPVVPTSVKPWLLANADPTQSTTPKIIDTGTWNVDYGLIGKTFDLTVDCAAGPSVCALIDNPPKATYSASTPQLEYVPATVTANSSNVCPSCVGATDYERSIECADANSFAYAYCGGTTQLLWDHSVNPGGGGGFSAAGAECLIHNNAPGPPGAQDALSYSTPWPGGPPEILGGTSSPLPGQYVTTSNSIVTVPIVDTCAIAGCFPTVGGAVNIVGYLQVFINGVEPGFFAGPTAGDLNVTVLNIVGCSSTSNGAPPVVGGVGTSPIAVRLITLP